MTRIVVVAAVAVLAALQPLPAAAQLFDPYIVGMMAGPVSDGPSILVLKRRGDKFLGSDTLVIACVAGAASGVVAHALPGFAAVASGLGFPIAAASLAVSTAFGCLIGAGGGAAAIATQLTLNALHRLEDEWAPAPALAP